MLLTKSLKLKTGACFAKLKEFILLYFHCTVSKMEQFLKHFKCKQNQNTGNLYALDKSNTFSQGRICLAFRKCKLFYHDYRDGRLTAGTCMLA